MLEKFTWLENCDQAKALILYLTDMIELAAAKHNFEIMRKYLSARAEVYSIAHDNQWFDYSNAD